MTNLAATRIDNGKIEAILRLQRLADMRDDLSQMLQELRLMADNEPDGVVNGLLESAALGVHNAAEATNHELNRLSFIASLALGKVK